MMRFDSWQSVLTGLGTMRDKLSSFTFGAAPDRGDDGWELMYDGSDLAARIVETLPQEAMREGVSLTISADEDTEETSASEAADTAQDALDRLAELGAWHKIQQAATWGRLFGGGAILVVTDDAARLEDPLDEASMRRIANLVVLEKRDLTPEGRIVRLEDKDFDKPEWYRLIFNSGSGVTSELDNQLIHCSRLILFGGEATTRRQRTINNSWDNSVLKRPHAVLRSFGVSFDAVSHMMVDSSQGVFKMKGLIDMIGSQAGKEIIQKRMQVVDVGRSVARSLVLDADGEDFLHAERTFTGVPETLDKLMLRLAAAARMPVTKLMGQSPAGMNATGESDRAVWEDEVAAYQTKQLKPQIERLLRLLFLSKQGPTKGVEPDNWSISFNALRQLTDLETADLRHKTAQTDALYVQMGALLPEEVALSRFTATGYSMDTTIDLEARKQALEEEGEQDPEPDPEPDRDPDEREPGAGRANA